MPKIVLNQTIQYKRKTYRLGETVEISVEDVDNLLEFGKLIEEQDKKVEVEQPKKSTKRNTKRADK